MPKELYDLMDIEIADVQVSAGVVYRASRDTDYNFVSGDSEILTPEEMRNLVREDYKALEENGVENMGEYFDRHYEITYRGLTEKCSNEDFSFLLKLSVVLSRNIDRLLAMN